jgi:two-component system OmpR family sensor kinase
VNRVSRLIEQILTLARLDPDYGDKTESILLQEFTKAIYEELQPQAAAKSIRFTLYAASPASIIGDATSLRALLRNLVDNAIRYTPENGAVSIELSASDNSSEIAITDTGPGMPENVRCKAFARFYRGDNAAEITGTGLGLAIAHRAAERLGARLTLKDGRNGPGLTAAVNFPSAPGVDIRQKPA